MKYKTILQIDFDSERKDTVRIGKPVEVPLPTDPEEIKQVCAMDLAVFCEAICTMIHIVERCGVRSSAESLRICIEHLTQGTMTADYKISGVTMPLDEKTALVGAKVFSLREFSHVPQGSFGVIDEDYGSGVMVAWDVPQGILPKGYSKYDGKPAVQTGITRDGFDKKTELHFLARVE